MRSNPALSRVLILSLLSLAFLPATTLATDFAIFGSYWKTDEFDDGWGGGARIAWGSRLQLQITGAYYDKLKFDSPVASLPEVEPLTFEISPIPVDLGIVYHFRKDAQGLYGGVGGSYYFIQSDLLDIKDETGYFLQVGFKLKKLFIEVVYRDVTARVENSDDLPIDLGDDPVFDLSGYNINLGWAF